MHILDVRSLEALEEFRGSWDRLLRVTPRATFFQSFDWLTVYWRHFSHTQDLRVLVVIEDGEPTGIVPLSVKSVETKVGSCNILTYPLDDWGSFFSPIGPQPAATLTEVLRHLNRGHRDWDMVDLRWIYTSVAGTETRQAMREAGLLPYAHPWDNTALIDLSGNWDEYWNNRSGKCRQTYRRAERRVAEDGEVEYMRYRPRGTEHGEDDPRWDLYDTCEEIARRSWQGASDTGTTLSHESVRAYLRDAHHSAVHAGAADVNLITVAGRPAAFAYNYTCQGWVHSLRVGFDPAVSDKGLGRLVMGRLIQDSFARGDRVIDMGAGSLDCKEYWLTSVESIGRYVHFVPTSPKARLLKLALQVDGWFRQRFAASDRPDVHAETSCS